MSAASNETENQPAKSVSGGTDAIKKIGIFRPHNNDSDMQKRGFYWPGMGTPPVYGDMQNPITLKSGKRQKRWRLWWRQTMKSKDILSLFPTATTEQVAHNTIHKKFINLFAEKAFAHIKSQIFRFPGNPGNFPGNWAQILGTGNGTGNDSREVRDREFCNCQFLGTGNGKHFSKSRDGNPVKKKSGKRDGKLKILIFH